MKKVDYKKDFKELYLPKETPVITTIPELSFIYVDGEGNPNNEGFQKDTELLYALSYGVRMSYKWPDPPTDWYEYTVFPLEGVWDLVDKGISHLDKDNLKYRIMIRQPDFLDRSLFERIVAETSRKKKIDVNRAGFGSFTEGLVCQMLHIGSYDNEAKSFEIMEEFCKGKGFKRLEKTHREIYLSDPRKTKKEDLKTVLRFRIV
jgi:hypothetical protein